MWEPSTDFAYGFGAGVSFFLLIEIVRCIRVACCKSQSPESQTESTGHLPPSYNVPIGLPVIAKKR